MDPVDAPADPLGSPLLALVAEGVAEHTNGGVGEQGEAVAVEQGVEVS